LWSPKGTHSWFGVSLKEFGDFAEANGRSVPKGDGVSSFLQTRLAAALWEHPRRVV
jgi:hypothetical protein